MNPEEEIPLLSPVRAVAPARAASTADEAEFSTLKVVLEALDKNIDALGKDFNAFGLLDKSDEVLRIEIQSRQIAFDILEEARTQIKTAIESVKITQQGGQV